MGRKTSNLKKKKINNRNETIIKCVKRMRDGG